MNAREILFPKLFTTATVTTPPDKIADTLLASIARIPANAFTNAAPLARKKDPVTSKLAAQVLTQSGARITAKKAVLAELRKLTAFSGPVTSHELSMKAPIPHPTAHKRLPDLRRDGLVENGPVRACMVTGRQSLTWKVKA